MSLFIAKNLVVALAGAALATVGAVSVAQASTFTNTSPSGGVLPTGVSTVGGIVLDLTGANGTRVTSQLAASQLFVGFYSTNPGTIGTQTGFTSSVLNALGGGIQKAGIRFTLYDGDSASGDFDFNNNTLRVNGLNFGNWSSVNTQNTDSVGAETGAGFSGGGFRNNLLDTGWFYNSDTTLLTAFYNSLVSTNNGVYELFDTTPGDNFYDFTQGVDSGLINVGTGPVVQPPGTAIPTPALLPGLIGLGLSAWRKRKDAGVEAAMEEA